MSAAASEVTSSTKLVLWVVSSGTGDSLLHSVTMTRLHLAIAALASLAAAQDTYGPVKLEGVDPLSLSWNQIHWLVRNQIKEVEDLKAEHDEIYNEIAGECSNVNRFRYLHLVNPRECQDATDWRSV